MCAMSAGLQVCVCVPVGMYMCTHTEVYGSQSAPGLALGAKVMGCVVRAPPPSLRAVCLACPGQAQPPHEPFFPLEFVHVPFPSVG
jgi:hypothetical protein